METKMNIDFRQKQKEEAIKRLCALHIYAPAVRMFRNKGTVMVSEPPHGALFILDEEQQKLVAEFEKAHNALVYLCTLDYFEFGKCLSMLYVSQYEEEWEDAMYDATTIQEFYDGSKGKCILVNVANMDDPGLSEIGSIAVAERFGGIVRIF